MSKPYRILILKKKFNVALPYGLHKKLKNWAEAESNETASLAAYLLQKAIEEAEEQGKIPEDEEITTSDIEKIKEYIDLLLGQRSRNGVSFALVASLLGKSSKELEQLYKELEQCRENKLKQKSLH